MTLFTEPGSRTYDKLRARTIYVTRLGDWYHGLRNADPGTNENRGSVAGGKRGVDVLQIWIKDPEDR